MFIQQYVLPRDIIIYGPRGYSWSRTCDV